MTDKYDDEVKAVQEGKMWPDQQGNLLGNILSGAVSGLGAPSPLNSLGQSVANGLGAGLGSGLSNSDVGYADKISQYKDYVSYKDFTIDDSAISKPYPSDAPDAIDWAEYKAKIDADKAKLDEQYKEQLLKNKISELEAKKNKKSLAKMLGLVSDKEIEEAIKKLTEELAEYKKKPLSWPGGIITDYKGSQLEQQALGVYYDKGFIKNLKANTPISSLPGVLGGYLPKPYQEPPQPEPAKIEVRVEEEPQGRKFKEPL